MSLDRPPARVLIVRLPCHKVYPGGPVYLASLLRRSDPGMAIRILDLAAEPYPHEKGLIRPAAIARAAWNRLASELRSYEPELVAFSWRDIQVFSPQDADGGFRDAFAFLHEASPIRRLMAALHGLIELLAYRASISRNLSLIARTARSFPGIGLALGGSAARVFPYRLAPKLPRSVALYSESGLGPFFRSLGLELPPDPEEPGLDLGFLESAFPQWPAYRHETIGVQTKRGCPRDCIYCLYPRIEGRSVTRRSPEAVVAEIESYARRWGARRFWLTDAQLLGVPEDRPHLERILAGIEALGLDIRWSGYLRVSDVDRPLAELMVRSGIDELEASLGSGSQRVVDAQRLGFEVEAALRGLEAFASAGYRGRVLLNLALNAPGEDEESLRETLRLVDRVRGIFGAERVVPVLFFLAIQPGTGLEELALAEGTLERGYDPLSIWPWRAQRLIYNPPPLGAMIGRACARAFRRPGEDQGDRILAGIQDALGDGKI